MHPLLLSLAVLCTSAGAQHNSHQHQRTTASVPPFTAVSTRPFAQLMDDAMAVMDEGMRTAPMNGRVDHDFITMMLPHHQGAIDMAKAVLLHTRDPAIRNLALGIIAEQQNEINLMRAWLAQNASTKGKE